jgi:asparagine synthase (glutamine-hydrolysing)
MNHIQRYRGPDDEGYLFVNTATGRCQVAGGDDTAAGSSWKPHRSLPLSDYDLVLGSRRLAILDLSPAGRMPMASVDGALWVTYNGEIYNYRELRETLRGLGYHFATNTDTEVILAAYAAWGPECVRRFNGMFAFALWDGRERRLFCARDHFGIKPFYYYWNGETFVFASEIKSLLVHPAVPRVPDERSIFDYLALCLSDHDDRTFFEGIVPLPAGCLLTLDVPTNRLVTSRWWQADVNAEIDGTPRTDEQRVFAEFRALLEDAIRLRLRSDVPVGTCLSGGIDSSSIACLANRLLLNEEVIARRLVGEHQKTFTARNREPEIDEYEYSRLVVEQTGAEEHLVFPDGEQFWQEVENFAWHLDQPVNSTSPYQQWSVMRLASQQGVTVLLDGQGGDEMLAGYHHYLPLHVRQIAHRKGLVPAIRAGWDICRVGGARAVDALYGDLCTRVPWRVQKTLRTLRPLNGGPGASGSGLTDRQLSPEFVQRHWERRWQPPSVAAGDGLAGVLYRDLMATNLPMLLRYEDRTSMAFSLEARLPFLDHRLVEFTFALPLDCRIRNGWTKWVLRRSLDDVLPRAICWRRSKLGFPTPEKKWLSQGGARIRRLLDAHRTSRLSEFVRPEFFDQVQAPGDAVEAIPGLWRVISLALWIDLFFNRNVAEPPERIAATAELASREAMTASSEAVWPA